jgi:hypothetical protein
VPVVGSEADYMAKIERARKAAGVDVSARETEQAAKLQAEREKLTKGKKRDLWAEAALGFLEMAKSSGTLGQAAAAGGTTFLTGAKEVMERVREDEKDLYRQEQAQEEMAFARRLGDADAVARAKEKDEDARRAAADRNAELNYGRNAQVFQMKHQILGSKLEAELADSRTAKDQAFKLKLYEMEAEKDLKAATASLDFKTRELMMKYTAEILKGNDVSLKDFSELKDSIRTNYSDQAETFVSNHKKGFDFKGQFIPPEEVEDFFYTTKAQEMLNEHAVLVAAKNQYNQAAIKAAGGFGRDPRYGIEQISD